MSKIHYSLFLIAFIAASVAAADNPKGPESDLQEVTITATKSRLTLLEAPATVTLIDAERLDRELISDIKDLIRYEPGVSVRNVAGRFGLSDFNIRGIEGNRVLLEVDNVRLPEAFAIGSFSNATRDGIDVDLLKRVEIVRGSASSLYGSNAIGGVVAFTTKDPSDLLASDKAFAGRVKASYGEEDESAALTTTVAARFDSWSALLSHVRRESGDYQNKGSIASADASRTRPNPQDGRSDASLAKIVWEPDLRHTLRLTLERNESRTLSDVITARVSVPGLTTLSLLADDRSDRERIGFEHEFRDVASGFVDSGEWRLYRQDSLTTQLTDEERRVVSGSGATSQRLRFRRFDFDERAVGAELTLRKEVSLGSVKHSFVYGAEFIETDIDQLRDGFELNRATGVRSPFVGIETFPVRDTPLTRTRETGFFVQDEITLGAWTVTPSVRIDLYDLEPTVDEIFTADNPGITPTSLSDTTVSPGLGVLWRVADEWTAFGSYRTGFRAPPFADVNVGLTNNIARYTTLPNADLKPETSDNYELGLRWSRGSAFGSLSVYHNRFDDFIESFSLVGRNPQTGFIIFQSRNLDRVEIEGVEFKGALALDRITPGLMLRTALSWGEGDDLTAVAPLNTVDPARAVFGVEYRPAGARFGTELVATTVASKDRINQAGGPFFAPRSYTSVDLLADWQLAERALLNVGVFNLFDAKYWEWADVRGRLADDPTLDFYTRPGRNVGVQLRVSW